MVDAIFAGNARVSEIDDGHQAEPARPGPPARLPPTSRNAATSHAVRGAAVIIVESNLVFRAGLIHVLAGSQFKVVAECPVIAQIPTAALEENDCILLVAVAPETIGSISADVLRLHENHRRLRVVALCDDLDCKFIAQLGNIAHAYFLKSEIGPDFILRSLEMVLLGATVFPRRLFEKMLIEKTPPAPGLMPAVAGAVEEGRRSPRHPGDEPAAGSLSGRERCILSHIMRGASNKHIARELGITEATVKVHVKNMLLKINAKNRTQAAMWGMKCQLSAGE